MFKVWAGEERVRDGWMGVWVVEGWVGLRVGFIHINDMSITMSVRGGVRVYEAYEVK